MGAKTKQLTENAEKAQTAVVNKQEELLKLAEPIESLNSTFKVEFQKYIPLAQTFDVLDKQVQKGGFNQELITKRKEAEKLAEAQRLIKEQAFRNYKSALDKYETAEKELKELVKKRDEAKNELDKFLESKKNSFKALHSIKMKAKRFFEKKSN